MKKKHKKLLAECSEKAYSVISMYLDLLLDEEKAEGAPINQLSSVIGVMMDRFVGDGAEPDNGILPDILKELKGK